MAESENQMATAFTSKLAGLNSTSQVSLPNGPVTSTRRRTRRVMRQRACMQRSNDDDDSTGYTMGKQYGDDDDDDDRTRMERSRVGLFGFFLCRRRSLQEESIHPCRLLPCSFIN